MFRNRSFANTDDPNLQSKSPPNPRYLVNASPFNFSKFSNNASIKKISFGNKIGCLLFLSLIGIVSYFIIIFIFSSDPDEMNVKIKPREGEKLTLVLNTFKRHDLMKESIEHYSKCNFVDSIFIIWSEKKEPPEKIIKEFNEIKFPKVIFSIQSIDSLNSRFKPLTGSHSDAVFSVDDDMIVPCKDLDLAFTAWKGNRKSIVGFMPRVHLRGQDGSLVYRCWWRVWWHGYYSIILTKAAIMHHDYFNMYTSVMPKKIRDLVDKERNCEDIAMQFLISNSSHSPPVYVKGHLSDKGALNGISTSKNVAKAGHMKKRSACLNNLVSIYGENPLVNSYLFVDSASNKWTNTPSTWFEYISSDLWSW